MKKSGLDPATARRYFLAQFGMTFQAYTRARRLAGALTRIREGVELDSVVFDSGRCKSWVLTRPDI